MGVFQGQFVRENHDCLDCTNCMILDPWPPVSKLRHVALFCKLISYYDAGTVVSPRYVTAGSQHVLYTASHSTVYTVHQHLSTIWQIFTENESDLNIKIQLFKYLDIHI